MRRITFLLLIVFLGTSFFMLSCSGDQVERVWYADQDGDGLGNPAIRDTAHFKPKGFVANNADSDDTVKDVYVVNNVRESHFLSKGTTISKTPCTLSDGTESICLQIVSTSTPADHAMGPWCPDHISDGADKGGIWIEGGEVYDVDGDFIRNMATFYKDDTWLMYDENGNINKTKTKEECKEAANPNVGPEYEGFCVECLPSYVANITQTYLIPITPVQQDLPTGLRGGGPNRGHGPSFRGLAFNGVRFDGPAPTDAILGAYTLAPFDDAGGHINLGAGYHYHAATGLSKEIAQADGHAPMIGYAMDGHGIYGRLDMNGKEPVGLDECRGHYDSERGYHYHVDAPGTNNFLNCLMGAFAK